MQSSYLSNPLQTLRMVSELRVPIPQRNLLLLVKPFNPVVPLPTLSLSVLPLIVSDTDTSQRTRNDLGTDIDIVTTIEVRFVFLEVCPGCDDSSCAAKSDDETTAHGADR